MSTYILTLILWVSAPGPNAGEVIYNRPHSYHTKTAEEAQRQCETQGVQLYQVLQQADLLGPAGNFRVACVPPLGAPA
jgi:hypothetical protein